MGFNIAIDGPAGAGKSTIAKKAAADLGFIYVDTGAMYRALALYFIRNGIDGADEEAIKNALTQISVTLQYSGGTQQVLLNGENVSDLIRTEEVSRMTSVTSALGCVREKLLSLQQDMAAAHDVIMDGRDIGTNVLPNADIKIYLTASVAERARRRYLEQKQKGGTSSLEEIEKDIIERDTRDKNRAIAPLRRAEDAVYLDTSDMNIDEVAAEIERLYREKIRS
ncbi:MAG TPA: (d)CMP kinase [Candidatus Scybalocola faecipullorum]|nr:(d)CMP kinase [Candidatus Scybalocola faecipullorum]